MPQCCRLAPPGAPMIVRLHDERIVLLSLVDLDALKRRQLQNGRALAVAQMRQQDDFSVGKLKGVMLNVGPC